MEDNKHLEQRMDNIENTLEAIQKDVGRLVQGIFGDEKLNFPGLLKSYDSLQGQIDRLKKEELEILKREIEDLKKVNSTQDVQIQAKKGLTDDAVKWLSRGFWAIALLLALLLLLTGKIGLADLINLK
jgi:chromosome segregation ATPase